MGSEIARRNEWDMDLSGITNSMMMMLMMLLIAATLPASQQISQSLQAQSYRGKSDSRTHAATGTLSWIDLVHEYPYSPWISAYFINDGLDAVEIAINYPNDRFLLNPTETVTVVRSSAQERIAIIFFKCADGETAAVRIMGEY